ncbi:hypothetical protein [Marasmitruncus massiliensis]|uniref:hypothetical protein n=1 Tax=Marasmitruncus massiliensis TaxID=1944642 RepID=UPI000C7C4B46|nr:hypothetical protein [Marasmitruncus massiliensis]
MSNLENQVVPPAPADSDVVGDVPVLTQMHTRAHIYRVFLKAAAYLLRHTIESCGMDIRRRILLAMPI